jgi:O-methyltransferase
VNFDPKKPWKNGPPQYDADHLAVWGKNLEFLADPRFLSAYRRGANSGHVIARHYGLDELGIEWRIHICCWAAMHAKHLPGDFVECGVNTGIMSLAVCEYIDFNATGKRFWLFDTYDGIPTQQMTVRERELRASDKAMYADCYEIARQNFAPFPAAQLVRGTVPDSLGTVAIDQVCYLCLDMNIAFPERAAIEHFWPRLVSGAPIVLDDYAWQGYEDQKATIDEFALSVGVEVLTLPTGQGLILKP